jgi:hypothetical protein
VFCDETDVLLGVGGSAQAETLSSKTVSLTDNTFSGTKAEFDAACSDGNFLYVGDAGPGDVTGPASAVDSEIALFDGITGKIIKRASISGIAKLTSGVLSAATAGTDFAKPDTASSWTANQTFNSSSAQIKGSSTGVTSLASANASATNYTVTFPAETMEVGFRSIPQITKVADGAPTTGADLTYSGKHIYHTSTAGTFTIPANGSIAYPIGTALTFVNGNGAGALTIAITTDTMRLAGAGTTGSRTLAANGVATAVKLTETEWIISGSGLT